MRIEDILASALAQFRKAHDISKRRHAELLGVDRSNYNRYASGRKFPSSPVLNRMLALGLNIKITVELVDRKDVLDTTGLFKVNKRGQKLALPLLTLGNQGVDYGFKNKSSNSTANIN